MLKQSRNIVQRVLALLMVGLLVVACSEGGGDAQPGADSGPAKRAMSLEDARSDLQKLLTSVTWTEELVTDRARIELGSGADLKAALPDIDQFPLVVLPVSGRPEDGVEIFVSTEKSGTGTDGWMTEAAQAFNQAGITLGNGRAAQVTIRKIASGTAHDYIASKKHVPGAYSPSNALWVQMVEAAGTPVTPVRDRTVGNLAGIVMKQSVAERLRKTYGKVDVPTVVDAVVQGSLVMGYTDPFASSTGLNFLVTVLSRFSNNNPAEFLSPAVVSAFEGFQKGVPFVALTTLQMRESVERSGSLDAFVMEWQTYAKTASLATGYEFIPFGVRHDNPLVMLGNDRGGKRETLEAFAKFLEQPRFVKLATDYGFNPGRDHDAGLSLPDGNTIVRAQRLWKEKKDAGRPIAAVFVCDVSGSMAGVRLARLKQALLGGAEFISPNNSIGLITFNNRVRTVLPVKPFDLAQKATFHAAVKRMEAEGNTAMYDATLAGLAMLLDLKQANPQVKPMLFVLTDGQTNVGHEFVDVAEVVQGLGIPVYTIGYEAKLDELKRLSSLVEAASLDAGEREIEYKIGTLFNAQM